MIFFALKWKCKIGFSLFYIHIFLISMEDKIGTKVRYSSILIQSFYAFVIPATAAKGTSS